MLVVNGHTLGLFIILSPRRSRFDSGHQHNTESEGAAWIIP